MIKPFTAEERQASKARDKANYRPYAMHWRTRCQSENEMVNTTGAVEDHSKQELKPKA